jgi:outer membrane protein assembly factor BamB
MRRRVWVILAVCVLALGASGVVAARWYAKQRTGDVHNANAPFMSDEGTSAPTTGGDGHMKGRKQRRERRLGLAWPMYGRDVGRTRDASDLADVHPPYRVLWRSKDLGVLEYPPSYRRGVLYLSNNSGWVSARNVFTGKVSWSRHFGSITGEPALDGKNVYFGSRDNHFYALSARTGRTIWRLSTGGVGIESSPALDNGRLYVSDLSGKIRALDAATGRVLWKFQASGPVKHGPALAYGKVYFGAYGGHVFCLRASDGALVWEKATAGLAGGHASGNFYATPAVRYGRVYIGNTDGKIYSFVASNGELAWTYTFPNYEYASPAVWHGRVYGVSFDGTIAALDARTGRLRWKHLLIDPSLSSPTVIGRLLYVADRGPTPSSKGHLYAFGPISGRLRWRFPDGKYSSVIAAAGNLVVAGYNRLYVLHPRRRR